MISKVNQRAPGFEPGKSPPWQGGVLPVTPCSHKNVVADDRLERTIRCFRGICLTNLANRQWVEGPAPTRQPLASQARTLPIELPSTY